MSTVGMSNRESRTQKHEAGGEDRLHGIFQSAFPERKDLPVGPGDDCAILQPEPGILLALTTDQVVESVHLESDRTPEEWACKLVGRTLSDLAAAGATPWTLSWTAAVPARLGVPWLEAAALAVVRQGERWGAAVVGGDLSAADSLVLTATALGRCERMPPGRSGAQPGDAVCVTGRLGNAWHSDKHLDPTPRLAQGQRLIAEHEPHALIDLSDGLATDLLRICNASGVRARIDLDVLPIAAELSNDLEGWKAAACDGEDYELLVVLPQERVAAALADPLLRESGLAVIGACTDGEAGIDWLLDGQSSGLELRGWEHRWS